MPREKIAVRERHAVKVACNACVGKKTKCDAKRPACSACQKRGLDCVFDTQDEDESRKTAMKRKTHELERENQCLRDLLSSYAESSPAGLVASQLPSDEMSVVDNPSLVLPSSSFSYQGNLATDAIIILTTLANGGDAAITTLYAVQGGVPWCNIAANIIATSVAGR